MSLLPERTNQKRGINFQLFCSDQDKITQAIAQVLFNCSMSPIKII